ncbi:Ldh family oxidoreductase [Allopusillimonas soli]|uniref:Ldh family oxidoreductase n=1 Tax=Allopusillimonas soli TaxID=659016 RepID=A0A853FCR7_9BURK|nr:Ldh family oxidoreductase [Allopusillimonas soli]NYT37452.1 Ldh family oxidoreductase [Allopusillimonas soli]TEA74567.1 Ldh family oxidoreductase [Allopusillimonas soli]
MNATLERLPRDALTELASKALQTYGLKQDDARSTAEVLVLADMFGLHTHGVSRVQSYGERMEIGGINAAARPAIENVAPSISRLDGQNGVGPLVGQAALQEAIRLARTTGLGAVFARASNHFGPISPYAYMAAQQGFASFICSNASTTIAPWGGREARLGNSPLGFGVPNPEGDPFLVDMAMSVVARAKIRNALRSGESIPATWATDKQGRATTDPQMALDGFLMAIGGHKGYGLALVVDLLAGLLSGASFLTHVRSWSAEPEQPQDLGHLFLLIDTARLGTAGWLAGRMRDFFRILHDTPPADPASPVLVPGEIELTKFRQAEAEGVEVEAAALRHIKSRMQKA